MRPIILIQVIIMPAQDTGTFAKAFCLGTFLMKNEKVSKFSIFEKFMENINVTLSISNDIDSCFNNLI